MGRLTLNPIPHIDPIGALMLVVAGFGWAKPVMVNPAALRDGRRGDGAGGLRRADRERGRGHRASRSSTASWTSSASRAAFFLRLVALIVQLNILLAIFNLIPIPPLDGYNVAARLPAAAAGHGRSSQYAPYGVIVLLLLVFLPGSPLRALLSLAAPVTRVLIGA